MYDMIRSNSYVRLTFLTDCHTAVASERVHEGDCLIGHVRTISPILT